MRSTTILLMLLLSSIYSVSYGQIRFQKLNLEEAKEQAAATNKQVFVDFRADWCLPCVEMERTTFSDRQVGKAINEIFIPIQLDVDYFKNMDIQESYNVSVLPTILIINSLGEVQRRLLGQKTAISLMQELDLPYIVKNGSGDQDVNPIETEVEPKDKKECFLTRWWRKITS